MSRLRGPIRSIVRQILIDKCRFVCGAGPIAALFGSLRRFSQGSFDGAFNRLYQSLTC
jgi:hypothetical protein